jgi:hypothetical protein
MAGETQNYHETRNPFFLSTDFAAVSPLTTSISIIPILRIPTGPLAFLAGYWVPGKKWEIIMQGKITTAATPGNGTFEIRHQTGTPTDAGGTILATSAATALAASKTNITWWMRVVIAARGELSTFVPTASPLYAYGVFMYDGAAGLFTTTSQNPLLIPASANAQVNVDLSLAGSIHIDMKRSGSTAEAITVQDLQVNALT